MGKKQTVEVLIEGGKASAAPPIGPTLGALKINIGNVVSDINEKTSAYKGMKVPVKITVDIETKEYEIEIGTPPASQLIKKELNIKKGSGYPNLDKVANISIEQLIKVAKMKEDAFIGAPLKSIIKSIAGSCNSLGVLIEGKISPEFTEDVDSGKYDKELQEQKTEMSQEKKEILKQQLEEYNDKFAKERERIKADKEKAAEEKAKTTEEKPEEKEGEKEEEKPSEEKKED